MSPLGTKRALAQSDVAEAVPIKPAWIAPCQSADGMHALDTGPSGPLAPVPPTGRIFLDQVSENEWVLTDVLTHQSQRVPGGGPWTLVQAGDCGELAIVQDDSASDQDPEVHLVEDLLAVSVHQDSNDVVFFSGGQFGKLQRMEKVLCMHKVGEAKIRLSDGMAMSEVGVMVVRWHRALGVRVFWAAFDIYRALGVTCHSKQPSKWFWNCAPAWERWLAEHFTGRQCILSKHGGYSSPDSAPVPFSERLFEQPAMSTLAFVVQLARWAWCPPQRGGLRDKMAIAAAKQALRALLKLACERSAGRICTFSVDDGWRCMWPRPSHVHDGPATFQASYDDGGMMDFGELCDLSDCSAAPRLTVLWKSRLFCTPQSAVHAPRLAIEVAMKHAFESAALVSFACQLCWSLSLQIELALADVSQGRLSSDWLGVRFRENLVDVGASDMNQQLFAYVSATVAESCSHNFIGIATDKASPCGGSLTNAVISFPNGKLAVCCPQVSLRTNSDCAYVCLGAVGLIWKSASQGL